MKFLAALFTLLLTVPLAFFQQPQFPTDPKTGRAIGAKQMTPEELRSKIDQKTKTLIIDVRDPDEFEAETIRAQSIYPWLNLNQG